MRRSAFTAGGWFGAACLVASVAWSCSGGDTNPFGGGRREQGGSGGTNGASGGSSGTSAGTDSGSSGSGGTSATGGTGGTSGASTGGEATGGMTTGGSTADGGAGTGSGDDDDGGMTGGSAGAGNGGSAGTPAGGAGRGGSPMGGAGASAGAGMGGAGSGGGGASGSGGMPGGCKEDAACADDEYCKKASCDADSGECVERGPECTGNDAEFDPVCGCDGITYWNSCVIEHEGFNVAMAGECNGNNRPSCTRDEGGGSCPPRLNPKCYRPVEMCGDPSPMNGFCWVLPAACPANEPETTRYCGGTAGDARCIGLCEVIDAENSFRRDAPICN